jgi:hypothetical protein
MFPSSSAYAVFSFQVTSDIAWSNASSVSAYGQRKIPFRVPSSFSQIAYLCE